MKSPFLLKIIIFILFLSILSACQQNKAVEETHSPVIGEQQIILTTETEANQSSESLPTQATSLESMNNDLVSPIVDFSVSIEITHSGMENLDFDLLQSLGVKYIRFNGILWSEIQSNEDSFNWDGMQIKEEFFRKANQYGMTVIPIVRGTPKWAQKSNGYYCGAILDEKLESFGLFMAELVNRYKSEEFNIHYWEIWNEPDIQPEFVKTTSPYGCWGDGNDNYYGGGNYANMLKAISPIIKDADSTAKILIGGLLLDCDPVDVGEKGRCQPGKEIPPKFLEGILMNGGGDHFEIVSYHGYATDRDFERAPWDLEENFYSWSARGGVVMGKFNYITELLSEYGLEKEVFLTETGYLCLDTNPGCINDVVTFYERQAQYGVWLLVRNWMEGIDKSFWFTYDFPGWRDGSLLGKGQEPKPIYTAIQLLNQRMVGAQSAQKLQDLPDGLRGYAINFEESTTWVVVSEDNDTHVLDLSTFDFSAYDVFNQEIASPEGKLEVFYPVYVDIKKQ